MKLEATVPRRVILQQEEAVEDEHALVNQKTLNLEKTYRSTKKTAETSGSSPLTKLLRRWHKRLEARAQRRANRNPSNRSVYRFGFKPIN